MLHITLPHTCLEGLDGRQRLDSRGAPEDVPDERLGAVHPPGRGKCVGESLREKSWEGK